MTVFRWAAVGRKAAVIFCTAFETQEQSRDLATPHVIGKFVSA